jgi:hypothetical protein
VLWKVVDTGSFVSSTARQLALHPTTHGSYGFSMQRREMFKSSHIAADSTGYYFKIYLATLSMLTFIIVE